MLVRGKGGRSILRSPPKLAVRWEVRARRTYQLPPFHHLTPHSALGCGQRERDHVVKDQARSFQSAISLGVSGAQLCPGLLLSSLVIQFRLPEERSQCFVITDKTRRRSSCPAVRRCGTLAASTGSSGSSEEGVVAREMAGSGRSGNTSAATGSLSLSPRLSL